MKRYLIRSRMDCSKVYSNRDVLFKDMIGSNMGNMLFPYSIWNSMWTKDTELCPVNFDRRFSKKQIEQWNEEYDGVIIPLANAFRVSFIPELENITANIKQLKLPCIVVGVGVQMALDKKKEDPKLAEAVRSFCDAVLEKSHMLGLRGEFTAQYLTDMGYIPEKDFTVIGCPSMYLHGRQLPMKPIKELTPESQVSMNSKISLPQKFHNFMYRSSKKLPNHHYVPQVLEEIRMMYTGKMHRNTSFWKKQPEYFPLTPDHEVYRLGKAKSFFSAKAWIDYLGEKDFSFGSRIHGNIAALLAGTPCFIVVSDERIRELVSYHNIPHVLLTDLRKSSDIFKFHEQADFSQVTKGHEKRFEHYLDFMHKSGLAPVYYDEEGKNTLLEERVLQLEYEPALTPYASLEDKAKRQRARQVNVFQKGVAKMKKVGKYI